MIEVFYATNRNVIREGEEPKFGINFNETRPQALRFGSAQVKKSKGEYKVAKITLVPEAIDNKGMPTKPLGSQAIYEALRERMSGEKVDVICLIHGYASDIETALERAAELKDKYRVEKREPLVFVFSWPSDAKMIPLVSYFKDRDDARASGQAVARAFLKLRDYLQRLKKEEFCDQSIHLVAHSMGNYALRHAFQAIRRELGNEIPRLLDNIFLMAADEDDDVFEHDHKLRLLPHLAKAVHVYFSPDDRALVISDATKRNPDRLGANGPRLRDGLPRKVNLIDCSRVDEAKGDLSNHQYYRLRPEVVQDVNQVLAGLGAGEIRNRDFVPEDRSFRIRPRPSSKKGSSKRQGARDDRGR